MRQFTISMLDKTFPAYYLTTREEVDAFVPKLMELPLTTLFGIDTETAALPEYITFPNAALSPNLSNIRLLQIFTGKSALVIDCHKAGMLGTLSPELLEFLSTRKFVAHNAIFDLMFLTKAGVVNMDLGCTLIATKILTHATKPYEDGTRAGLDSVMKGLFGVDVSKHVQNSDWTKPELTHEQIEYAALDPVCCYMIAELLKEGVANFKMGLYYKMLKKAQNPIANMQLIGVKIDKEKHKKLIEVWREELYTAKKKVKKITGLAEITSHTMADYLERTLPPEMLSVWPKTDTGKLQTDAHVFADFSSLEIVKPFAEFQKKLKLCTSFGASFAANINPATGRIHPRFNICGARTGRISCTQPNLQQLPRDASVRELFIPEEGNVLVVADYSQVELRVAAELSRDEMMLKTFREGKDIYTTTAAILNKKREEDVTKPERQYSKCLALGLLFGLGAKKFSHYAKKGYGVETTEEEANVAIKAFRKLYSGYRAWQLLQAETAEVNLYAKTTLGKYRRLDPENTFGTSMNTPVQGSAAEIMLIALTLINKHLPKGAALINVVHDEVIVECKESLVEQVKPIVEDCMKKAFLIVFPKGVITGIVEASSGKNWAEAK